MQASNQPAIPAHSILAVIVLYQRDAADSESLSAMIAALQADPVLAATFSVLVYDNSAAPQTLDVPADCSVAYVHDGRNGGLAPAYNHALAMAQSMSARWLLLLDQDTSLPAGYLQELRDLSNSLADRKEIGAIVPKLVANSVVYSPESNFLYQLRNQFRRMRHPVEPGATGIQPARFSAYNSGTAIRVSALEAIDGFPAAYWLDYLDHATFHALSKRGYLLYVMQASLEQKLSHMDINLVPHWRHRNVLTAQTRFVVTNGGLLERTFFRIYLLRTCRFLHHHCRNRAVWKEMLWQAVVLSVPSPRLADGAPEDAPPSGSNDGPQP